MVNIAIGGGRALHTPPSTAWANFSIIMEFTSERGHCHDLCTHAFMTIHMIYNSTFCILYVFFRSGPPPFPLPLPLAPSPSPLFLKISFFSLFLSQPYIHLFIRAGSPGGQAGRQASGEPTIIYLRGFHSPGFSLILEDEEAVLEDEEAVLRMKRLCLRMKRLC
jgi:hypothetical protein